MERVGHHCLVNVMFGSGGGELPVSQYISSSFRDLSCSQVY